MRYSAGASRRRATSPAPGDFDGDGIVDPTVFRPGDRHVVRARVVGQLHDLEVLRVGRGRATSSVPADYDGDGKTDAAVFRPSTGTWYIRPSGGGAQWSVVFGGATDVPLPGHYDGDGKADIAVYRPSTGTWFVLTSRSGYTDWWYRGWGINAEGDMPAPGDYDGDGKTDLCVFRPASGTWFILESHDDLHDVELVRVGQHRRRPRADRLRRRRDHRRRRLPAVHRHVVRAAVGRRDTVERRLRPGGGCAAAEGSVTQDSGFGNQDSGRHGRHAASSGDSVIPP